MEFLVNKDSTEGPKLVTDLKESQRLDGFLEDNFLANELKELIYKFLLNKALHAVSD